MFLQKCMGHGSRSRKKVISLIKKKTFSPMDRYLDIKYFITQLKGAVHRRTYVWGNQLGGRAQNKNKSRYIVHELMTLEIIKILTKGYFKCK